MNIGIILLGFWGGIGGAEKRYVNLFRHFISNSNNHDFYLLMHRNLYNSLNKVGFVLETVPNIVQIEEPRWIRFLTGKYKRWKAKSRNPSRAYSPVRKPAKLKSFMFRVYSLITFFHNIFSIINLKRKLKLDILHGVLDGIPVMLPYFFSRKTGTVMSFSNSTFLLLSPKLVDIYESWHLSVKKADALDILNSTMKRGLIERGYDVSDRGNVAPCSFTDYSRTFSFERKERIVVFSGRMMPSKNPLLFVEIIPMVISQLNDKQVKFVMMGSGPLEGQLRQSVIDLGLQAYVEVRGFVQNPVDVLAKSLVFVQLSEIEGHPSQSMLEAMACKNAIIITDDEEIREIVSDDVGFRVEPTPQKIADKLAWLLNHPIQAEEIGKRAQAKVIAEQTVERYADYLRNVYEKVYQKVRN